MTEHQHDPALARELRALLESMAERAEPLLRKASDYTEGPVDGELPATCHWCPLCAAIAVLRGQRPELAVRAAEQAVVLLELLRAALTDPEPEPDSTWTDSGMLPAEELAEQPVAPERAPRVQHIEVRRRETGA